MNTLYKEEVDNESSNSSNSSSDEEIDKIKQYYMTTDKPMNTMYNVIKN